jgi:hypothetical protein
MPDVRRALAKLNRWWQGGLCYSAVGVPLVVGIVAEAIHSETLIAVSWVLIAVGFAVNLTYVLPLTKLLLARRASKRARR